MTSDKNILKPWVIALVTLIALMTSACVATLRAQEEPSSQPAIESQTTVDDAEAATDEPTEAATDEPAEAATDVAEQSEEATTDAEASEVTTEATPVQVEPVANKNTKARLILIVLIVVIIAVCIFISSACVNIFKMPENRFAYFVIAFCLLVGLISTLTGLKNNRVNLGIDLRGGSILVYSVSPSAGSNHDTVTNDDMNELKNAIMRRINPSGVREISIQELGANTEIKITIPEADDTEVARLERVVNDTGQLKFRILASRNSTDEDEKSLITLADRPEFANEQTLTLDEASLREGIVIGGEWLPVDPTQEDAIQPGVVFRETQYIPREDETETPRYDVLVLTLDDSFSVNGDHIQYVQESVGQMGEPEVVFTMHPDGAKHMQRLTDRYKAHEGRDRGRQLGVVFNNRLFSAPNIKSTISDRGSITFGNDLSAESRERIKGEVRDLITVMHAGVLPAELSKKPVTKMITGPTLGADTIKKGTNAILWGGVIVLLFIIVYYGFGGFVAAFAVLLNLLLIMTAMIGMHAAFTLPGLAGLVLTVGMAVDANVLIFERIREELNGGATLRMAVKNGYQRAFTAIFDSNITTMLTAWILYLVGSEQIKSFAVTLFLGVCFSMLTATYICRVIFQSFERKGWISNRCVSPLLPVIKPLGRPNWNFFALAKKTYIVSVAIIIVGLIAVAVRGKGVFDVDFVGGVEIQMVLTEPTDIADIRSGLEPLAKANKTDLAISELQLAKDRFGNDVEPHSCYTVSVSCPVDKDADVFQKEVEQQLKEHFADRLRHYTLDYTVGETTTVTPTGSTTEVVQTPVTLNVNPALSYEVIDGYFADALEGSELRYQVTNEAYEAGSDEPANEWTVLFNTDNADEVAAVAQKAQDAVNEESAFEASNTIGSSVASYARTQGAMAIFGSLCCIIAYLWFRFKRAVYGLSAVVGLIHDVCFTLGLIGLSYWLAGPLSFLGITQFKIGLATVAAFLTLVGYSLNDTIVLFDRIREIRGRTEALTPELINRATNQTFSRTMLTSLTTLFSVVILYCFGGAGIHTFAFAMVIGVIVGTYSSIFICAPFLYWLLTKQKSKTPSNKTAR
ncbi:MAG: protein translocase subunit SecD [Planctomycetia bacterium]|nr:protein translocase subunit SecD [Planctomycetia bacterium]